jgi:subtilisin family serine protease
MPWEDNRAWDRAIADDPDIAVGGHEVNEFLYRPRQLVCDRIVWEEPRDAPEEGIRGRLGELEARSVTDNPTDADEERRGAIARNLDLHLLDIPRGDVLEVRDEARDRVRGAVGLVHVMTASPQRHGGSSPPKPFSGGFTSVAGGAGIRIAVLDTGISDPAPFAVEGPAPEDVDTTAPSEPAFGHGTMVAGVIARFASEATLVIRRVLAKPNGTADEIDVAGALDALPNDIDIVNASFSGRAVDDATMVTFKRAVDDLPAGTVIVAAAGNEKRRRPQFMAAFKRVIGVAAVRQAESGAWELEDYSNRGWWCDMCTEGTDIATFGPDGLVECCGTSFATPQVTAKIASDASAQSISVADAAAQILGNTAKPLIADAGRLL